MALTSSESVGLEGVTWGKDMSAVKDVFDGESLITPEMIAAGDQARVGPLDDRALEAAEVQMALLLNVSKQRFESGQAPASAIDDLFKGLHQMRRDLPAAIWSALVPIAQNHPVSKLVHTDPFTRRSFEKPRGYSGDAGLLDFIYRHESAAEELSETTDLGKALYAYTSDAPASVAVRERRDLLARHIDAIASTRGSDTEILTIAAGHLREAELSTAMAEGRIKRWVALDQDPMSIGAIMRDKADTCIDPMHGSVKGLLTDAYGLGDFDFVYAAGLYDYLPFDVSVRLTKKCLSALKPGGVYLFANFHDDIPDDGYMETFMNWSLILRSEAEVQAIVDASIDRNVFDARVECGENRNIVYAIITRR